LIVQGIFFFKFDKKLVKNFPYSMDLECSQHNPLQHVHSIVFCYSKIHINIALCHLVSWVQICCQKFCMYSLLLPCMLLVPLI